MALTKEEERIKALVEEKRYEEMMAALNKLNSTLEKVIEILKPTEKTDG